MASIPVELANQQWNTAHDEAGRGDQQRDCEKQGNVSADHWACQACGASARKVSVLLNTYRAKVIAQPAKPWPEPDP